MGTRGGPPELSNRALVERHSAAVFRAALAGCGGSRIQAEDIMQDVFMRLVQARPSFESNEHAKAWLLRVTINCCTDMQRSAWRRQVDSLDELQERGSNAAPEQTAEGIQTDSSDNPVAQSAEAHEQRDSILVAVMALPPKQRVCAHLFYFEDQSIAQIADLTNWPTSTIKSHLRRGRSALRSALGEEYDYDR